MLFTIMDADTVLGPDPAAAPPAALVLPLDDRGAVVLVQREHGRLVVQRVVSTDPAHYLDPRLAPGTVLGFPPR